jgi:hypothetical protein
MTVMLPQIEVLQKAIEILENDISEQLSYIKHNPEYIDRLFQAIKILHDVKSKFIPVQNISG